jgi:hypothetical protein
MKGRISGRGSLGSIEEDPCYIWNSIKNDIEQKRKTYSFLNHRRRRHLKKKSEPKRDVG